MASESLLMFTFLLVSIYCLPGYQKEKKTHSETVKNYSVSCVDWSVEHANAFIIKYDIFKAYLCAIVNILEMQLVMWYVMFLWKLS